MKKFIYISIAAVVCLFYSTPSLTKQRFAVKAKLISLSGSTLCKIIAKPLKKVSPPTKKNRVALKNAPAIEYFQLDEIIIESQFPVIIDNKCGRYYTCCLYSCDIGYRENNVVGDTIDVRMDVVVEQETKRELNLKLYPNPMQNESRLEIENYGDEIYSVELYDISGKLIRQESNLSGSVYIFQRNDLPSGIYIWRFITEKNLLKSGRLIAS